MPGPASNQAWNVSLHSDFKGVPYKYMLSHYRLISSGSRPPTRSDEFVMDFWLNGELGGTPRGTGFPVLGLVLDGFG